MTRLLRISFDLGLVLLATVVAIALRTDLDLQSPDLVRYIPYLAVTTILASLAIGALKLDVGYWRHASLRDILSVLAVAALTAAGSTATIFALNRLEGIARTIPLLQFVFVILVLLAPRLVARCATGTTRQSSHFGPPPERHDTTQNVLIVGFNAMSTLYIRSLAEAGARSVKVIGLVGLKPRETGRYVGQTPILGTADHLTRVVSELAVHGIDLDRVVMAVAPQDLSARARLELQTVATEYGLKIDSLAERVIGFGPVAGDDITVPAGLPLARTAEPELPTSFAAHELERLAALPYWRAKRTLDVLGALILIAVLLPVSLAAMALAVIDVGFPVVFWQVRVGMGGGSFRLLKLRTMSSAYDPHGVRVPDTARTSLVGTLLRRTRLDELPQLWNVLVGDMSLIGPRPLLAIDQPSFESGRLLVRPGLTGWAQVCGGRDISADNKAALDVWYIRNASFGLDLRIVAATVRMLALGERVARVRIESARAELQPGGHASAVTAFPPIATLATRS